MWNIESLTELATVGCFMFSIIVRFEFSIIDG